MNWLGGTHWADSDAATTPTMPTAAWESRVGCMGPRMGRAFYGRPTGASAVLGAADPDRRGLAALDDNLAGLLAGLEVQVQHVAADLVAADAFDVGRRARQARLGGDVGHEPPAHLVAAAERVGRVARAVGGAPVLARRERAADQRLLERGVVFGGLGLERAEDALELRQVDVLLALQHDAVDG